ncbi:MULTISPECIES: heavy metal translocating P-type ATPase [Bacillus]|uniref:heavy metal translocating P-type ATPase n=1 Tax=Bacillus TaxID=1386 RepID=UPI0013631F13|nr:MULTISPECIES: heavy metal translocating P-type ATPase [Bacillus amyloliquefaciens group]MBO3651728.1 cadmium-translocating P-type ATPase [Bacillus amyloliquefaciens]MCJ2175343.1 cadmium-translocating P-type ATPase [Bacillus amyloliquefaciens]MCR4349694.1 heavy metal translocating P-type ATPase [Bacillus amyloliquefaciens]MCR4357747.1 heavy metal translocating P-type ATPase [Bacillus amyloliquefaciens]MDK4253855.1 heavy metal translocating P-type ATPase [Bacillus velezensis]
MKAAKGEFVLDGLDCSNCAKKIENGVKAIDGIDGCAVNFAASTITVSAGGKNEQWMKDEVAKKVKSIDPHVTVRSKHEDKPGEDEYRKKLQLMLVRLAAGAVLAVIAYFAHTSAVLEFLLFFASYLIIGGDIVARAGKNIVRGQVFDEHFLMALATIGAFMIHQYPEGVAVMLFYQIGELFQGAAVSRSRKSISALLDIRPEYANVKTENGMTAVPPQDVKVGQVIVVNPGERIPLDGKVLSGSSMVDTSALTGESVPRKAEPGQDVMAGFMNQNGVLHIETSKGYEDSAVSKILDLVENAAGRKAKTENFITKFAKYYTPVVVIVAVLLAFLPPLLVPSAALSDWVYRALIFLVISCPCALVVSIPLGFFGGIGAASKAGVLVKGSNYLEALNQVAYAVFDKTGTLTKGNFAVTDIKPAAGFTKDSLLHAAALAEAHSNHPIASSIREAYNQPLSAEEIEEYEEIPGHGIRVKTGGSTILAGNQKLMAKEQIASGTAENNGTVVYVAVDQQYAGAIVIADEIKEDAKQAIANLKALGVKRTVMLTGDSKQTGEAVGRELGIDDVYTELLPGDKVDRVEELEAALAPNEKLMFVGDGINDTPVLARADIGAAMGALGSDAAVEAADVVLMTDQPSKAAEAIRIARRTRRIVWQNIGFALGVKIIFLLLGAFGFATMWEAVFSDVGVTLIAVANAMRVMRVKAE